jgi:DNA polymerase elongation subunit (family B)
MIKLGIDYRADRALIFDKKSYILQKDDGSLVIKGNTLRGRNLEPLFSEFILTCINLILGGDKSKLKKIYEKLYDDISNKRVDVKTICRRGTLNMTIEEYQTKRVTGKTNKSGLYEAAMRSDKNIKQGDVIYYYVTNPPMETKMVRGNMVTRPAKLPAADKIRLADEFDGFIDVEYYLDKLEKTTKRFMILEDFEDIFPIKLNAADLRKLDKIQQGHTDECNSEILPVGE